MNTVYRINIEMEQQRQRREYEEKRPMLYAVVFGVVLAGLLVAGACNAGETVELSKYLQPATQETREKQIKDFALYVEIMRDYKAGIKNEKVWAGDPCMSYVFDFFIDNWEDVRKIMEGEK